MTPSRRRWRLGLAAVSVVAGCALIGFAGWQFLVTNVVASRQQKKVVAQLQRRLPDHRADTATMVIPGLGEAFGIIHIPRMHLTVPLIQGARDGDLSRGIGHAPETMMPGAYGNFAIAGHRTTHGHPLWSIDKLRAGDKIYVTTKAGTYTYVVTRHWVVKPTAIQVYSSTGLTRFRVLTMTSCNPRYSARERYVVRAELEDS